jgi:hypothetical protein
VPLTVAQIQSCYLYTGHLQVNRTGVFVGGQPESVESTHIIQVSLDNLTANGLATVTALLITMDALYAELGGANGITLRLMAAKIGDIETNPKEWRARMVQWNFFRQLLARTLDVALDPISAADGGSGAGGGVQGPWREP